MNRTVLKDAHYRVIGYIDTAPDGKQIAKDARYHTVGHYDPTANVTKDDHYRVVGQGNLLATLLSCR